MTHADAAAGRRPAAVVLRGGTVLTMDDSRTVLTDADVLVVGRPDRRRRRRGSTCPRARRRSTPAAAS